MSIIGSVSLSSNTGGLYLGKVNIQNLNTNANQILYSYNGSDISGVSLGTNLSVSGGVLNSTAPAGTTINNQGATRLITSTATNNTLNGEANLTWDGINKLGMTTTNSNYLIGSGTMPYTFYSGAVSVGSGVVGNGSVNIGTSSYIGNASVCVGSSSGKSGITGSYNCILGYYAGRGLTTGGGNIIVGSNCAQNVSTGNNNVLIAGGAGLTTGSNNVLIGGGGGTTQSNNTIIGIGSGTSTFTNCSILGANINVMSGDNQVQIGDSTTSVYCYGAVQNRSDSRDKNDIRDTTLGLNFINELRPVDFRWDFREDYVEHIVNPETQEVTVLEHPKDGSKKRNRYHHGLIAQEVRTTCDRLGVDFGGYQNHSVNGGGDKLTIGYEELIAPLIKAIQELNEKVKNLELRINK